ncbi:MAG: Mlc titration factor MtfA (ptsG expression regulator) [Bradymonadia bacterium]|jgi:Mlc titration factor MtfA (ptsG expression regulator)
MLSFFRRRRRKHTLAETFPPDWLEIVEERLSFYSHLDEELQTVFRDELQVFLDRVEFFGASELEITDEMRVVIGGSAVRLILGLDESFYLRLKEIVVYPHDYRHPDGDESTRILGEAHHFGTVVLSWPAVLSGVSDPNDGHDTAVHEFAHVLDKTSLGFDGTPRLRARADYAVWGEVLTHHYDRLREGLSPEIEILRMYGATNEAEFFAVATEAFFERPDDMEELAPDLFEELARFYGYQP